MRKPLEYTIRGANELDYFRLYECEHITDGAYPAENALPVGDHTNIALCAHCWQHAVGMAIKEIVSDALKGKNISQLVEFIELMKPNGES